MRKTALFVIFLLTLQIVYAREEVSLDSCYIWARENYPNLKQAGLWKEITALQKKNIETQSLPQITLNGQASYQSEVTGIDIPAPDISIPRPSKDQYKAYAEIRQSVWDGGLSEANARLEDALLQSHMSELEVEIYKLNEQVMQAFFTRLISDKQLAVLQAQKTVLEERLKATQSAIRHGTAQKTAALTIQAEIMNLEQNELQLTSVRSAALQMLSVLTGKTISSDSEFAFTEAQPAAEAALSRPEMQLFENQRQQLNNRMELLDKSRNPKVFGFGQAGYGKPGLNMLSNTFDTYYLIGAGISWNPFDWKNKTRQKKVLQLRQDMVSTQERTFIQNINLLLVRQQEEISKLKKMLETDRELVGIRSEITAAATSQLENEILTASEYIREVQSETIAKLNYELHKIQLNEAHEKYILIKGNLKIP